MVVEYVDFGVVLVDIAKVGRYWWLYLIEVVRGMRRRRCVVLQNEHDGNMFPFIGGGGGA
jgi:hypothetical protein